MTLEETLRELGVPHADPAGNHGPHAGSYLGGWRTGGEPLTSYSPATGEALGRVGTTTASDYDETVVLAAATFARWRLVPAPQRGELMRELGEKLRTKKAPLARLVTMECGKILSEAEGEVQEMIDMADYVVGLSRQIGGITIPSERPDHRLFEQWHPLGPVGVITAFNFPVAVWAWNAMIAAVCGDTVIWKPSEKTPLTALAVTQLAAEVLEPAGFAGVFSLVSGGRELGERLAADRRIPLLSATGSCAMGKAVAATVGKRLGRSLLELGGNNAVTVLADADLDLALRAILFGAVGTAGQRCTTTRRLLIETPVAEELEARLVKAYGSIEPGDPLAKGTLLGPLIDEDAVRLYENALEAVRAEGGEILCGAKRYERPGHYVAPTLVRVRKSLPIMEDETFAPILYIQRVQDLDQAIALNNSVRQGFSSAIFTRSQTSAERFLAAGGSDCGIANVNLGTSGAEIGGAFGGEKETGGGREAGSDAWKAYMRRQTCTVNYGSALPLAQGVEFDVG